MSTTRRGTLSTQEAGKALDLSRRKVISLADKGVIKAEVRRSRRIHVSEIMRVHAESAR